MPVTYEQASAVMDEAEVIYAEFAPIVGMGVIRIGDDFGLKVSLESQPRPSVSIPANVKGVPIRIVVADPVVADDRRTE